MIERTAPRLAYSIAEAQMAVGGISRDTIDRMIQRGELRTLKIGRRRFISAEELQRYIREREAEDE